MTDQRAQLSNIYNNSTDYCALSYHRPLNSGLKPAISLLIGLLLPSPLPSIPSSCCIQKEKPFMSYFMNAFLPPFSILKIGCMLMVFLSTKVADGDDKWACGNNAIVEDATLMIAAKLCSATTALVGKCCEGHDECYRIMSNTKRCCDSAFCSCLRKSAIREPWYRYLPCLAFAELACVIVKHSAPDVFKPYKPVPPTCG